jgi:hypothetical protein
VNFFSTWNCNSLLSHKRHVISSTTSGMLPDVTDKHYRWRISDVRYRRRDGLRLHSCGDHNVFGGNDRHPPSRSRATATPHWRHPTSQQPHTIPCRQRRSPAPSPCSMHSSPTPSHAARAATPYHPHTAYIAVLRRAADPGAVPRRLVKMLQEKERE